MDGYFPKFTEEYSESQDSAKPEETELRGTCMPGSSPVWKRKTMKGTTVQFPVEMRRALGFEDDEPADLCFFLEDDQVVVVAEKDAATYLLKYLKRRPKA